MDNLKSAISNALKSQCPQRRHHLLVLLREYGTQVEQHAAFFHASDDRRLPARRRADISSALRPSRVTASRRVGRTAEGAAPPPITDSPSMISTVNARPSDCGDRLRAAANLIFGQMHHAQRGNRVVVMLHVGQQRGLQRGIGQLVHTQGSEQGVGSHAGQ